MEKKTIVVTKKVASANVGDILYWNDEFLVYMNKSITFSKEFVEAHPDTFAVFKEKSAETLGNELGFKVGDKIWYMDNSTKEAKYYGQIKSFHKDGKYLDCTTDIHFKGSKKGQSVVLADTLADSGIITNKVAIHTPTKEDFGFIFQLLNIVDRKSIYGSYTNNTCLVVNHGEDLGTYCNRSWFIDNNWLVLTIDQYMESIGNKPILITEDGINIYQGMYYWIVKRDATNNKRWAEKRFTFSNDKKLGTIKYFSTEQLATEYLESLKPKFETGKRYIYNTGAIALYNGTDVATTCFTKYGAFYSGYMMYISELENGEWKLANMDKIRELLLNECMRRYKEGMTIVSTVSGIDNTLKNIKAFYWSGDAIQINFNNGDNITVYYNGKFSEVISQPKVTKWLADSFQVKKLELDVNEVITKIADPKGRIFDNERDAIYHHARLKGFDKTQHITVKHSPENIKAVVDDFDYSDSLCISKSKSELIIHFIHRTGYGLCTLKDIIIDKKNTIEVEIPEGYEYNGQFKNADCDYNLDTAKTEVNWKKKQPINNCGGCLFMKLDGNNTKCNTCKAYNNWQSKQDLTSTKIFIGDNPRLSKLVQEKAFELGWYHVGEHGLSRVKNTFEQHLYFNPNKNIGFGSSKAFYDIQKDVEISAQDLGIKEKDYKVLLVTTDGVNIYNLDKYWFVRESNSIACEPMTTNKHLDKTIKARFSTKELAEQYVESLKPKTIVDKPCNSCKYTGFNMDESPCVDCITQTTEFKNYIKSK